MNFNTLSQKLIDAWVASSQKPDAKPEDIYGSVQKELSIRARLSLIDVTSEDPKLWVLSTIRHSRVTARILNLDAIFSGGRLGDLEDQAYLEQSVLPAYHRAIESQAPVSTPRTKP